MLKIEEYELALEKVSLARTEYLKTLESFLVENCKDVKDMKRDMKSRRKGMSMAFDMVMAKVTTRLD